MGFGKDGKGVIIVESRTQALLTLANATGILIGTKLDTVERFRMLKAKIICNLRSMTGMEGNRLVLYLADGDLTLAEIEQMIEGNGPLGPNDVVGMERAERPVFPVSAVFDCSGADPIASGSTNNSTMITTLEPRWTFAPTKSWNWVLYNNGIALTTAMTATIRIKSFGVWVT